MQSIEAKLRREINFSFVARYISIATKRKKHARRSTQRYNVTRYAYIYRWHIVAQLLCKKLYLPPSFLFFSFLSDLYYVKLSIAKPSFPSSWTLLYCAVHAHSVDQIAWTYRVIHRIIENAEIVTARGELWSRIPTLTHFSLQISRFSILPLFRW